MKTVTQTRGLTNGYNVQAKPHPRRSRRGADGFLSKPCNKFTMPPEKWSSRAARPHAATSQKTQQFYDGTIIAQWPLLKRVAFYVVAILAFSGFLPMAVAAFQICLYEAYGLAAFLACMVADCAFIHWMVRHAY